MNDHAGPLALYHRWAPDGELWRVLSDGVHRDTERDPLRTTGPPLTCSRISATWSDELRVASAREGVPVALLVACVATESKGDPNATRFEPGYRSDELTPHLASYGLMQTLLSTAREVLDEPMLQSRELFSPLVSLVAGAAYIRQQSRSTFFDPVLVACAYNAGSLRYDSRAEPWRLHCWGRGEHAVRFARFYGDALAVLSEG